MSKKILFGVTLILVVVLIYLLLGCRVDIASDLEKALYPLDSHTTSCGYYLWAKLFGW